MSRLSANIGKLQYPNPDLSANLKFGNEKVMTWHYYLPWQDQIYSLIFVCVCVN